MSNREKCLNIINALSEEQLEGIAKFLLSAKLIVDDAEDDAFCLKLLEDYENSTDPEKDDFVELHEFAESLGISLDEL